jgi:peptidoglycan glycosyltransferase
VNRPIVRLFGLLTLMFALLVAFTSRWTVFEASSLRNNPLNARLLLEQQRIDRGPILAADGTPTPTSEAAGWSAFAATN